MFLRSIFINQADINGWWKLENNELSSANNSTSDYKLSGILFISIKKKSSTYVESCGISAWTDEQDKDSKLKPTLWNLLLSKLWCKARRFPDIPILVLNPAKCL